MTSTHRRTPRTVPIQLQLSTTDSTAYDFFSDTPTPNESNSMTTIEELVPINQMQKRISLVVLTIQNSAMVLIIKHSRSLSNTPPYLSTTTVLMTELIKLIISIYVHIRLQPPGSAILLKSQIFEPTWHLLAIPAALYTIQNNLQYLAMSRLDVATYAVSYQLKILTTAICSMVMLNRNLTRLKWGSLVLLAIGVAIVQVSSAHDHTLAIVDSSSRFVGFMCVVFSCILSGLAGVYFEKLIKTEQSPSVWIRNVQLSLFSLVPALFSVVYFHGHQIVHYGGFFQGYTYWTWLAILIQALGGLIVSMVVMYADNIIKGFATSVSIIISSVVSIFLFGFVPSPLFVLGAFFVLLSSYIYGSNLSLNGFAYKPIRAQI